MNRIKKFIRGATLMETLVASALSAGVMGTAIGLYVKGTSGFYNEQSHSYMQFRTRTALDRMSSDVRGASAFLNSVTIGGTTYTANPGPSPAACMILQVPAQDASGLMYYGTSATTPNAPVTDTIVYYYNASDSTLRRTVSAASGVVTNLSTTARSSSRTSETATVVARNVSSFTLTFKDHSGSVIASSPGQTVASIDIKAQILGTGNTSGESPLTVSGVRLRNVRGGTIQGTVLRGSTLLSGVPVQAIYATTTGAYASGTVLGASTTDSSGNYTIYGLIDGAYSVKASPSGGTAATASATVQAETSTTGVTVTVP
jgi:Tfp pilus assembly protein PilW